MHSLYSKNGAKFDLFYPFNSVDKAPVSKLLLGTVASVSTALIVAGPVYKSYFIYSPESIFNKVQVIWNSSADK